MKRFPCWVSRFLATRHFQVIQGTFLAHWYSTIGYSHAPILQAHSAIWHSTLPIFLLLLLSLSLSPSLSCNIVNVCLFFRNRTQKKNNYFPITFHSGRRPFLQSNNNSSKISRNKLALINISFSTQKPLIGIFSEHWIHMCYIHAVTFTFSANWYSDGTNWSKCKWLRSVV